MSHPIPPLNPSAHTPETVRNHVSAHPQIWLEYIDQLVPYIESQSDVQHKLAIRGVQLDAANARIGELKAEVELERNLRFQAAREPAPQACPLSTTPATNAPTPVSDPSSLPARTSSARRSERIPDPAPFGGDRKELRGFVQAIQDKMLVNHDRYPTPAERVVYTISRLTGTARAYVLPHARPNGTYKFDDYTSILDLLRLAFGDPNLRKTARNELFKVRQTNKEFSTHIAEFQRLAAESETHPEHLIDLLEESLSQELRSMLKHLPPPDDSYESLVNHLRMLDNRLRTFGSPNTRGRPSQPQTTASPSSYATVIATPAIRVPTAAPATPTEGDPMDLSSAKDKQARKDRCFQNNLCFRCQQPGHMIANCPLQGRSPNRSRPRPTQVQTHAAPSGATSRRQSSGGQTPQTPLSRTSSPRSPASHRSASRGRGSKKGSSLN